MDLNDLTISQVLALAPATLQRQIINGRMARVKTPDGRLGVIYWDADSPSEGWTYDLMGDDDRPDESGELNTPADLARVFA